jgi:hypothetical protein
LAKYYVDDKLRRIKWGGNVVGVQEKRNEYRVLVEKPEGKRPLRRPRHRWEYNIKMHVKEIR